MRNAPKKRGAAGKRRGKVSRVMTFFVKRRDGFPTIEAPWHAGNGRDHDLVKNAKAGARGSLRSMRRIYPRTKFDLVRRVITDTVIG